MFAVTFLAVSKVLVATFVGALMKSSVPSATTTLRDFNFINTMILLPCLTVANTAKSVDLQVLIRCSALLLFGLIFILVGIVCAMLTSPILFKVPRKATGIPPEMIKDVRLELMYNSLTPEEEAEDSGTSAPAGGTKHKKKKKSKRKGKPYVAVIMSERLRARGVTGQDVVPSLDVPGIETETFPGYAWGNWLGCSIQNTIALPLPILQTLSQSIPWVDYTAGSAYIFVFSIMCTIWTWSGGPIIVEFSQKESVKRHLIREIIHRHLQMPLHADATTQTGRHMVPSSSSMRSPAGSPLGPFPPGTVHATAALPHAGAAPSHDASTEAATASVRLARHDVAVEPVQSDPSFFAPTSTGTDVAPDVMNRGMQTAAVSPVGRLPQRHFDSLTDATAAAAAAHPHPPRDAVESLRRKMDGLALDVEESSEQISYDWEAEGLIRAVYESDLKAAKKQAGVTPAQRVMKALRSLGGRLIRNVNFVSIFVGMFIGIVPFVRNLFFNGPLEILMDAAILLGGGNVPASLLLLGASLVGTAEVDATGGRALKMVRDSEQNTEFSVYERALDLLDTEGAYEKWFNQGESDSDADKDDGQTALFDTHGSFVGPPPPTTTTTAAAPLPPTFTSAAASTSSVHQRSGTSRQQQQEQQQEQQLSSKRGDAGDEDEDDVHDVRPAGTINGENAPRGSAGVGADDASAAGAGESDGCLSGLRRFLSMDGISPKFLWGIIFNRLFLCTLVGFMMTVFCLKAFPFLFGGRGNEDKTMVVVLFLQVAAPAAINTSLLYNNREYMVYPWARMLLFMYLMSTVTVVAWVTVSLSIVEGL